MSGATLTQAKAHLRIDHSDEDAELERMLETASAYLTRIDVPVVDPVPAPVISAQLLLVAHLYANRGEGSAETFRGDLTWRMLIQPYRSVSL